MWAVTPVRSMRDHHAKGAVADADAAVRSQQSPLRQFLTGA
jgi:hypothetical protein